MVWPLLALALGVADGTMPAPTTGYACPVCECTFEPEPASVWPRFVVGAVAGYGYIHVEPLQRQSPLVQGASSFASQVGGADWAVFAGALWANGAVHYGALLGFSNYRDSTFEVAFPSGITLNRHYRDNNVDLLGEVAYDLLPQLQAYLLSGPSLALQTLTLQTNGSDTAFYDNKRITLSFGGGFAYRATRHLSLILESRYSLGTQISLNRANRGPHVFAALRSTNLGVTWTF